MTADRLVREHRGLALSVAARFYLPGGDRDDVDQEALIGLWRAAEDFDGTTPFRAFAALVIRRRLMTAIKLANRQKHKPLNDAIRDTTTEDGDRVFAYEIVPSTRTEPHRVAAARETLAAIRAAHPTLTPLERVALRRSVNGIPYAGDKQLDNAQQRAIRKLRRAAA